MNPIAEPLDPAKAAGEPPAAYRPAPRCPKCDNDALVQLVKAMRRYSCHEDWFRCDKCDYLFTCKR